MRLAGVYAHATSASEHVSGRQTLETEAQGGSLVLLPCFTRVVAVSPVILALEHLAHRNQGSSLSESADPQSTMLC